MSRKHPWHSGRVSYKRTVTGAPKPTPCQESQVTGDDEQRIDKRTIRTATPTAPFSLALTLEVGGGQSYRSQMHEFERRVIEATLSACRGSVVATARSLRLPRQSVYDAIFRHSLDPADYRRDNEQ